MLSFKPLKRTTIIALLFAFVMGLATFISGGAHAHAAGKTFPRTPSTCGQWSVVSNPAPTNSTLLGVTALGNNYAWAVGYQFQSTEETLIEQWDGDMWNLIPGANPASGQNVLRSVSATSATDAWAVGYAYYGSNPSTLIEHWDGTAWSVVPSPNGGLNNDLYSVTAISATDAWAVGYYYNNSLHQTLTEHWDGSSWSIVSSPNPGTSSNMLSSVTAFASNDVWAVGDYVVNGNQELTLTEHWNGSSWSVVSSPNPNLNHNQLNAVTTIPGSNQLWSVGERGPNPKTLTERWNGTSWKMVASANPPSNQRYLYGVASVSPNQAWAVGLYSNNGFAATLNEQWNGTNWTIDSIPNQYGQLLGVTTVPGKTTAWTVGEYFDHSTGTSGSLIEFYC